MHFRRRTLFYFRLACITIALTSVAFIVHRIDSKALAHSVSEMHLGWFLLGLVLYTFLFVPTAYRWNLALRCNESSAGLGAAFRLSLIGHFLYVIFFGAAGGDTAKSALYSRWYQVPLRNVLAAASLDRLLGFLGLLLFGSSAVLVTSWHGGFSGLGSVSFRWHFPWVVFLVLAVALVVFVLSRLPAESAPKRFLQVFLESGRRLIRSPRSFFAGVLCGIVVQAALSGVLALCLKAVSPEPIPWAQLVWTLPVISVASALPVTFAGLGVRDSAAVVLFGLCHVSPVTAVAASLLTALISLICAVGAGALLWHEAARNEPEFQLRTIFEMVPR